MRVEFTNAERTEAVVTRGWWRWKRQAQVVYNGHAWRFASGNAVADPVRTAILLAAADARDRVERERRDADWVPVRRAKLPRARLVERSGK